MSKEGMTVNEQPLQRAVDVTPSDSGTIDPTDALWIGTGGDVTVRFMNGTTTTLKNVADGTGLRIKVDRVTTATTADDIVALYL